MITHIYILFGNSISTRTGSSDQKLGFKTVHFWVRIRGTSRGARVCSNLQSYYVPRDCRYKLQLIMLNKRRRVLVTRIFK